MQARTFFCHEPDADDFDRSTSFEVIRDIVGSNAGFFQGKTKEDHPGFRTARYASADDAKLSLDDIAAWDDLVRTALFPWVLAMAETIEAEIASAQSPAASDVAAYRRGAALMREKAEMLRRTHETFMEPYERATIASRALQSGSDARCAM